MPKRYGKARSTELKARVAKSAGIHILMAHQPMDRPSAKLGQAPWRSIGVIGRRAYGGFVEIGTCFLYREDVVVTAGHVVNDESAEFLVAMAFDGHAPTPWMRAARVMSSASFDIGIAILPAPVHAPPLSLSASNLATGQAITLAGYGYDYTYFDPDADHRGPGNQRMTSDTETITRVDGTTVFHDVNSAVGDSGGPLMVHVGEQLQVAAIHLGDDGDNHGVILSPAVVRPSRIVGVWRGEACSAT